MLEDKGISLSESSKPKSTTPALATPGFAHTYSIHTFDKNEDSSKVLVVNSGPDNILAQFKKLPKGQELKAWVKISKFIQSHQGSKKRDQHGQYDGSLLMDLVIFDVSKNIPIPKIVLI